jgi:two-component system, NarL family, invasion response regulator UvrY
MITILIADDHPIVRAGLKQIINEIGDMRVTDEANDGQEVLDKIRKGSFDIVVLDLSMPGISGMDVLKQIKKEKPLQAVLVLSHYPEEQFAIPAFRAGAAGYVAKTSVDDELIGALRKVASGKKYISETLAEKMIGSNISNDKPLYNLLSEREYEILCLIASGKSISNIGEDLHLSPSTISTYRSRIMKKLNIENNADLIRYALENNLN